MTEKAFLRLLAFTLACVALAAMSLLISRRHTEPDFAPRLFLPALAESLADIASIHILDDSEETLLERRAEGWVKLLDDNDSAERPGYFADESAIMAVAGALARLELVEPKTASPKRLHRLALADAEDKSAGGGAGRRITVKTKDGKTLADILIGRRSTALGVRTGATYVRHADAPQSWLAKGTVDLPLIATDWYQREILNITEDEIVRIAYWGKDGTSFALAPPSPLANAHNTNASAQTDAEISAPASAPTNAVHSAANLQLSPLQEGERADASAIASAQRMVTRLQLSGVKQLAALEADGYISEPLLSIDTEDGRTVAIIRHRTSNKNSAPMADVWYSFVPSWSDGYEEMNETGDLRRLEGWAYALPTYAARFFSRSRSDFLTEYHHE